jgi:hypothetical protein
LITIYPLYPPAVRAGPGGGGALYMLFVSGVGVGRGVLNGSISSAGGGGTS